MDFSPHSPTTAPAGENATNIVVGSGLSALQIRAGHLADLFPLMAIITKELSLGRQHLAMATVSDVVKQRSAEHLVSLVAVHDGKIVAGALATRIADDAAQFVGFGCHDSVEPAQQSQINQILVNRLHQRLQSGGFRFVQSSCDATDHAPACGTVGYQWIATLDYLGACVDAPHHSTGNIVRHGDPSPWRAAGLDCLPINPCETAASWQRIVDLVQSTYEETLDCPRLNAFRSVADVLGGYVTASCYQPEGWRIVSENGRDVACLVTVIHRAAKALELTYMGVAPSHRGRGIGRFLVGEAAGIARKNGADRIVLAVDRVNRPAREVYHQCGFENVGSEAVWGRKLSPAASEHADPVLRPGVHHRRKAAS